MKNSILDTIVSDVRKCTLCEAELPLGARPVLQVDEQAKILIAGQAPGIRVHESGVPFTDPSGDRLRQWMGIDNDTFYDASKIAILPMGFCYPGTGKSGDLPPRPECAKAWRSEILAAMPNIELILVIGIYAQKWHMSEVKQKNLTETVRNWRDYWPELLPLPHPSPRNNIWLKKNPWFEQEVIPHLQQRVALLVDG
ncbi:uracil-DNA glycosylase family protein [Moritella sp. Urea-trap-13]|uniref:uracil-DNA glycosylase family protein n=1 Tax=Moritella sp. Urea-trap-13 TaxID=2058327 RepID=UPI000C325FDD|nr:uracil-DNA glycosylase family protein [Moritella sp. Urea-trap-13]PKH06796.1 uracil-DNA glycosylase [Moritella sp. Urea-trap-13]